MAGLMVVIVGVSTAAVVYEASRASTTTFTLVSTTTASEPPSTEVETVTSSVTQTLTVTQTSTVTETLSAQTSASTTSSSCSSTSTSSVFSSVSGLEFLLLIKEFSGMSVDFGDNSTLGPQVVLTTYAVEYAPTGGGSTYKVGISQTLKGVTQLSTIWISENGTVVAFDVAGQNVTGSNAEFYFVTTASPFIIIGAYSEAPFGPVPLSDIHSTGQSTANLGGFNMTATTYSANSLPLTFGDCFGNIFNLNTFVLRTGTVPGSSFKLLTYLDLRGTDTVAGAVESYSVYVNVNSAA